MPQNNKNIYDYIEEYFALNFTENKNKSIQTKISYYGKMREFADILTEIKGDNFDVSTMCFDDLQSYVNILGASENHSIIKNGRNNSASSVSNKYTTAKILVKFLKKKKILKLDITKDDDEEGVSLDRVVSNDVKFLGEDECKRLLQNIKWKGSQINSVYESEYNSVRNATLIFVCFTTGLRRFELLGFEWDNIVNNTIVIKGKGRKEREIPLKTNTQVVLNEWRKYLDKKIESKSHNSEGKYDSSLVFPSNQGNIISDGTYWNIIEKAFVTIQRGRYLSDENGNYILDNNGKKIINPNKLSGHNIRKGFASLLNKNGTTISTIQYLLGHSDPSVTSKYVGVSLDTKRKAIETINIDLNFEDK